MQHTLSATGVTVAGVVLGLRVSDFGFGQPVSWEAEIGLPPSVARGWWPFAAIGRCVGPNQSSSCATGPRTRTRRDSTPVLTALMLCVVGHIGSIGWVSSPKGLLFPTTLPVPTAMGSTRFVCNVSWGASSPSAPLVFVFVYALA